MTNPTIADRALGVGTADVTLGRVFHSEWIKLRSVRSTTWSMAIAVLFMLGIGVLATYQATREWNAEDLSSGMVDPTFQSLSGLLFAQIPVGVLGALAMTGEYATGLVRATMGLVPRRVPVIWAKAIALAGLVCAVMLPASLVSFFIGQAVLDSKGFGVGIGAHRAVVAILGCTLYLVLTALMGLGLGALLRHTAGAVAAVIGAQLGLPLLADFIGHLSEEARYFPILVGEALASTNPTSVSGLLSPGVALLVMCGYAAVGLVLAAVVITRRDV